MSDITWVSPEQFDKLANSIDTPDPAPALTKAFADSRAKRRWKVGKLPYIAVEAWMKMPDLWLAYPLDGTSNHMHFDTWREAYDFALKEARSALTS